MLLLFHRLIRLRPWERREEESCCCCFACAREYLLLWWRLDFGLDEVEWACLSIPFHPVVGDGEETCGLLPLVLAFPVVTLRRDVGST